MWWKKTFSGALAGVVAASCLLASAGAAETPSGAAQTGRSGYEILTVSESTGLVQPILSRATGSINATVPANSLVYASESFPLESGETVTINCSYSPASASMDFGLVDSDGIFYSLNVTGGSINKTIQVSERGSYTLAIRNNSSSSVRVVGFVNY